MKRKLKSESRGNPYGFVVRAYRNGQDATNSVTMPMATIERVYATREQASKERARLTRTRHDYGMGEVRYKVEPAPATGQRNPASKKAKAKYHKRIESGDYAAVRDAAVRDAAVADAFDAYAFDHALSNGKAFPTLVAAKAAALGKPAKRSKMKGKCKRNPEGNVYVEIVPYTSVGYNIRRATDGSFWNGKDGWLSWPAQMWGHGRWETAGEARDAAKAAGFAVRATPTANPRGNPSGQYRVTDGGWVQGLPGGGAYDASRAPVVENTLRIAWGPRGYRAESWWFRKLMVAGPNRKTRAEAERDESKVGRQGEKKRDEARGVNPNPLRRNSASDVHESRLLRAVNRLEVAVGQMRTRPSAANLGRMARFAGTVAAEFRGAAGEGIQSQISAGSGVYGRAKIVYDKALGLELEYANVGKDTPLKRSGSGR